MYWPNPQDYNEAVQWPEYSFEDEQLKIGTPEVNPLGLPKPICGNFASVYKLISNNRLYAAKCFLRNVYNQHQRYAHLSQFMAVNNLDFMIDFEYQLKGIQVQDQWYPIVKMGWVEGLTLDQFLRKHMYNREQLDRFLSQFVVAVRKLKALGIAHGDLQHGNIIARPDSVMLVDYDGFFVPAMHGQESNELGHPNYQHPGRTEKHFNAQIDQFSAWIIYHSVHFLRLDPTLWQRHSGGDDSLLFRKSDYEDPTNSRLLYELERHPVPEIKARAEVVRRLLSTPYERIPAFMPESSQGLRSGAQGAPSQSLAPRSTHASMSGAQGHSQQSTQASQSQPQAQSQQSPSTTPPQQQPSSSPVNQTQPQSAQLVQSPQAQSQSRPPQSHSTSHSGPNQSAPRPIIEEMPKFWPSVEQFSKAITEKDPFSDLILNNGELMKDERVIGNRGVVFKIRSGEKFFAVKCFRKGVTDRRTRYEAIAKHDMQAAGRYLVSFQYQSKGVQVNGTWFPILKMSWVEGQTLDSYVRAQLRGLDKPDVEIRQLLSKFREMTEVLSQSGIAHGDLEPRNILVDYRDRLKLVDYDAMYVPSLAYLNSAEAGESIYQHPGRTLAHYGPYLDNFSALLIDSILTFMATQPPEHLWNWNTLLQQMKPGNTWGQASNDASEVMLRRIGKQIREMWKYRIDQVPALKANRSL